MSGASGMQHGVDGPRARDALQLVLAAWFEREARAGDEILDGARDEDLARPRERGDAGADVDGDAAHGAPRKLHLAGVDAAPELEAELARPSANGDGAPHGARRPVEDREEAVARRVD